MTDFSALRTASGLVAIITGAGRGMGAATARVMAQDGVKVAVTDIDEASVNAVVAEITAAGGTAAGWVLDVSDHDNITHVVHAVADTFGGIDIVVNNAGIAGIGVSMEDDVYDTQWDRIISVNLTAHQRMVRAALPWLRKSRCPRIVNIASTEALGATMLDSSYVASKAGVAGLTRAMAVDLGKEGITVNCICPGPIDTPMNDFAKPEEQIIFARRRTALRRYGLPEEVAHMTLSLCLPASTYLTGTVIPVDGGLTARNG